MDQATHSFVVEKLEVRVFPDRQAMGGGGRPRLDVPAVSPRRALMSQNLHALLHEIQCIVDLVHLTEQQIARH